LLEHMVKAKTIDAEDMSLLLVTDSVSEAMAHIREHGINRFGLQKRKVPPRRSRLLRE
jgi:hypothetical protein